MNHTLARMVQYGGGLPSVRSGGRNQLFRTVSLPRLNLRNVLLLLAGLCVLRNLLKNDYRSQEIQYLRESGFSEEQIEKHIPGISGNEKKDELQNMKNDIAYLMKEVEELKTGRKENSSERSRGESLRSMDSIHEKKRRMKEEQLLRDHPDFKPSKRLKDTISGLEREPKIE